MASSKPRLVMTCRTMARVRFAGIVRCRHRNRNIFGDLVITVDSHDLLNQIDFASQIRSPCRRNQPERRCVPRYFLAAGATRIRQVSSTAHRFRGHRNLRAPDFDGLRVAGGTNIDHPISSSPPLVLKSTRSTSKAGQSTPYGGGVKAIERQNEASIFEPFRMA